MEFIEEKSWKIGLYLVKLGARVWCLVFLDSQCRCHKWEHKKCSGIKGSMSKVMKSFICRGCLNLATTAGRTSVHIGACVQLELVDKFCYLGDTLSVDGDADAAVEARIRTGWNKFR